MTTFIKIDRIFSKILEFLNSIAAFIVFAIMIIITVMVISMNTATFAPYE